jgi:hypothetical protein
MTILDHRDKVQTGDVLIFSGNTASAFLVKMFTSSEYNHVGVGIWLDSNNRISFFEEDKEENYELYVMEINVFERYDILTKKCVKGFALTRFSDLVKFYNRVNVRNVDPKYRPKKYHKKVKKFIQEHMGVQYCSNLGPIMSVWIGCPFTGLTPKDNEMFCCEIVVKFYIEIFSRFPVETKPAALYRPEDFVTIHDKSIFMNAEYPVYIDYADYSVALILPLIVGVFFAVFVSMMLPRQNNLSRIKNY